MDFDTVIARCAEVLQLISNEGFCIKPLKKCLEKCRKLKSEFITHEIGKILKRIVKMDFDKMILTENDKSGCIKASREAIENAVKRGIIQLKFEEPENTSGRPILFRNLYYIFKGKDIILMLVGVDKHGYYVSKIIDADVFKKVKDYHFYYDSRRFRAKGSSLERIIYDLSIDDNREVHHKGPRAFCTKALMCVIDEKEHREKHSKYNDRKHNHSIIIRDEDDLKNLLSHYELQEKLLEKRAFNYVE